MAGNQLLFPSGLAGDPKVTGVGSQFAHPTGWVGWLAGHLMGTTNKTRGSWVRSLLDLQPADTVLEIGFGSGTDVRRVSLITQRGFVAGIDLSQVMLRQAQKRNAEAIRAGRVALRQASAADPLPYEDATFTKVYSINSFPFWPQPLETLREVWRVLKPGGSVAIAVQPLVKGMTEEKMQAFGQALVAVLQEAGFVQVRLERKPLWPVAVVCALGTRP